MSVRTTAASVLGHVSEYVERYTVLGIGVLTSVSGFLGTLAADLGGADTAAGRAVLGATAALSTASAGLIWLRGRREWKLLETFGPLATSLLGGSGQDKSVPVIGTAPKAKAPPKAPAEPPKPVQAPHAVEQPTVSHDAPTKVVPVPPTPASTTPSQSPPPPAAPSGSQGSRQDPTVPTIGP